MKTKDLLKYFVSCGAVIYTIASALILFISLLADFASENSILKPEDFLYLLAFAYIISLANTIFRIEKISAPIRRLIHALLYICGLLAFLMLRSMEFYVAVIIAAVFGIIYALVIFVKALIAGRVGRLSVNNSKVEKKEKTVSKSSSKQKKAPEKKEYKNRFS